MYNLQITGNAIWEMLRHFVPSADHKRAQLAYALAELVLDCRHTIFSKHVGE